MNRYQKYGDYSQPRQRIPEPAGRGGAMVALAIGAGIGAALAVLFTPRKGSDLRRDIQHRFRRTVDNVSARTRDLREHGSNLLDFARRAGQR